MLARIHSFHSYGSYHAPWYLWLFIGLAVVIIFPDELLENVGLAFTWRNLIWLEAIFISLVIVAMILLKSHYPGLRWYFPFLPLGLAIAVRVVIWFSNRSDDN
jgi:hypothetical protein